MNVTLTFNIVELLIWILMGLGIWKALPEEYTEELGIFVGIGIEILFSTAYLWFALNYDIQIL
jgi:hypothetical protein